MAIVSPYKFKVNATGSLTINGKSDLLTTHSSTAPEVALALINLRLFNMNNLNNKAILSTIINDIDLSEEEVTKGLNSKNMPKDKFLELIGKTLDKYSEENLETIARILSKKCKSVSTDNVSKRRNEQREIILESIDTELVREICNKEDRICLILDNYSTHRSKYIQEVVKILNITLIYLPPYSPHLNPIEQIWRILKRKLKQYDLESEEFLNNTIIQSYAEIINDNHVIDNWYEKYIPKVW